MVIGRRQVQSEKGTCLGCQTQPQPGWLCSLLCFYKQKSPFRIPPYTHAKDGEPRVLGPPTTRKSQACSLFQRALHGHEEDSAVDPMWSRSQGSPGGGGRKVFNRYGCGGRNLGMPASPPRCSLSLH